MNVLFAINSRFVLPLCTTLTSFFHHNGTGHNIYVFHNGLNKKQLKTLNGVVCKIGESRFFPILFDDCALSSLQIDERLSIATYYRLLLGNYIPESVNRLLWLDADTLVLDDLSQMYCLPLHGFEVAACRDIDSGKHSRRLSLSDGFYLNAGVILFDLKATRNALTVDGLHTFLRTNKKEIMLHDQDILNLMFSGSVHELPSSYNIITLGSQNPSIEEIKAIKQTGHILHFAGMYKPWHRFYLSHLDKVYFIYLKKVAPLRTSFLRIWHIFARAGHSARTVRRTIFGKIVHRKNHEPRNKE